MKHSKPKYDGCNGKRDVASYVVLFLEIWIVVLLVASVVGFVIQEVL